VSRQYRTGAAGSSTWLRAFARLQPRWVYALGAIAVVAMGTVLLVPSLSKTNRSPATEGVRMNLAKNSPAPATVPPGNPPGDRNGSSALPAAPPASPLDRPGVSASSRSQEVASAMTSGEQLAANPAPQQSAGFKKEAELKATTDTAQLAAFSYALKTQTASATANESSERIEGISPALNDATVAGDGKALRSRVAGTSITLSGGLGGGSNIAGSDRQIGGPTPPSTAALPSLAQTANRDADAIRAQPESAPQIRREEPAWEFGKKTGSLTLSGGERRANQTIGDMPVNGVFSRLAVQRFSRSDVGESLDKAARAAKPDLATPVLASFQIEQAGNQVRVIDNDGSVYTGSVEPVTTALAAPAASPARFLAPAESDRLGGARGGGGGGGRREINTRMAGVVPAAAPQPAQRLYSFRVSGTNRTLQQPVVFMWNYVPLTNTPVAPSQPATANAEFARDRALLDEKRGEQGLAISGQVRLGEGKETAVEAAPAAP